MIRQVISGGVVEKFNGLSSEELCKRSLPDLITYELDIVFVDLYPSLNSVYNGKHYAEANNHFWSCLYESKLVNKMLSFSEDKELLNNKIGSVNMLKNSTLKNVQELSFLEIKEAQEKLNDLMFQYKPKIVAFNGKSVFEVYTGKSVGRDFNYGKQPTKFEDDTSDSFMYVLPSSEARGASYRLLPNYTDKVPFYSGLKRFQCHLNKTLGYSITDADFMFPKFQIAMEYKDEIVSDSDDSTLDENNQVVTARVNSFIRLNNLPLSQIPSDILENFESQRKRIKDVVINTDATCYQTFRASKKSASNSKENFNSLVKTDSLELTSQPIQAAILIANNQPSNYQQQQSSINKVLNPNSSILNVPCITRQIKQIQPKPPIINLGSANNNQALKQILSQPIRNITANIQSKPVVAHYSQPLKLSNIVNTTAPTTFKIVNMQQNQTINEKVAPANVSTNSVKQINESNKQNNTVIIVNQNNSLNSSGSAKQVKILSKPKVNQAVVLSNEDTRKVNQEMIYTQAKELDPAMVSHQQTEYIPAYLIPDERMTYATYELVFQDRYMPSEYYTFNDSSFKQQQEINDHVKALKQVVRLNFEEKKTNRLPVKRYFSDIQEAENVIMNSREEKRECKVNLFKL